MTLAQQLDVIWHAHRMPPRFATFSGPQFAAFKRLSSPCCDATPCSHSICNLDVAQP